MTTRVSEGDLQVSEHCSVNNLDVMRHASTKGMAELMASNVSSSCRFRVVRARDFVQVKWIETNFSQQTMKNRTANEQRTLQLLLFGPISTPPLCAQTGAPSSMLPYRRWQGRFRRTHITS